jgi:hypothetical protein
MLPPDIQDGQPSNIYETHVNIGGHDLPAEGTGVVVAGVPGGNPVADANAGTPLRDANGNLQLAKPDGSLIALADNGSFDIISREVMRVRVPKALAPQLATVTRADGSQWVEISVSTPNGISNRLQIPVRPGTTAAASAPQPPGYTIPASGTAVTLAYYLSPSNSPANPTAMVVGQNYADKNSTDTIPIALAAPALVDPSPVDITFDFDVASGVPLAAVTIPNVAFNPSKMIYPVDATLLAKALQAAAAGLYSPTATSLPSIKTTTITVAAAAKPANPTGTPKDPLPGVVLLSGKTDKQLTITFKYYVGTQPAPAAGAGQAGGVPLMTIPTEEAEPRMPALPSQSPVDRGPAPPPPHVPPGGAQPGESGLQPLEMPTPRPTARRDGGASRTAYQAPAAPVPSPITLPPSLLPPSAVAGGLSTPANPISLPGGLNPLNVAGQLASPAQATAPINPTAAGRSGVPPVMVLPQRAPIVNVQVPINNNMTSPKAGHFSLFHRRNRQNATPQNPTRPPLRERLFGNP